MFIEMFINFVKGLIYMLKLIQKYFYRNTKL